MSSDNKVVWSEGMFLSPQHFQQHDRYIERYVESRCSAFGMQAWGVHDFTIDAQLLSLGKVSLLSAHGVFPDGTPFNLPESDEPPPVLDVPENTHQSVVYLALPVRRPGAREALIGDGGQGLVRYEAVEQEIRDSTSETGDAEKIQLGKLRLRLLLDSDDLSGYACVGLVRIAESRDDKNVLIDETYIPPCLDCKASQQLSGFISELAGMLRIRADEIAGRLVDSRRAGTAQVADYMMLQLINRSEPLVTHYAQQRGLHPIALFSALVQLLGELATFSSPTKRSPQLMPYSHEELQQCFTPVFAHLRKYLATVTEQTAIALSLIMRKYGIRVAEITDRTLLASAQFILAVKADVPTDTVRARFPSQVTIGPVERIRQLVNVALPGIQLAALPVAPRQIPFHTGFTYFELNRKSEFWKELLQSGGFAMHIGGEFPGLELEFWAIRE